MYFTISIFAFSLAAAYYANWLRSVHKHSVSQFRFSEFQKETMEFLRKSDDLSAEDFATIKEILKWNEKAFNLHSCRRSSGLHIQMFFQYLRQMILGSYEIEKRLVMIKSENPDILRLQKKLMNNLNWSVFYNTPIYLLIFVNLSLATLLLSILATIKIYRVTKKEALMWYSRVVKDESREFISHNWQSLQF